MKRLSFELLEDRRLLSIGVGDFVWNDLNSNGLQDPGELGLVGAGVELYSSADSTFGNADDALITQTVTDAAGHYSFEGLSSGVNYFLTFRIPVGYTFTAKHTGADDALDSDANAAGVTDLFTLSADEINLRLDAGVKGSAPSFGWASRGGGTSDDYGRSVAADAAGNAYVAGTFSGTADFDPGPGAYNLTSVGGTNVFVAKYSSTGALLWARSFSGGDFDSRCQLALDSAQNVLITGAFSGAVDFDPGLGTFSLSSAGGDDIFVSKLDSAGNFLWARSMGGSEDDYGLGIAIDGDDGIHTTGSFQGTADFDPGPDTFAFTSQEYPGYVLGYADIFISKLNAQGNFVWARQLGGYGDDYGTSIAVGSDGSVYTTGSFQYWADFDPGPATFELTSSGDYGYADVFVSKLDAAGNFVWARQMGGAEFDAANSIAVANDGSVFTAGYFRMTADFDPGEGTFNLTSTGSRDIFISKLNASGNFVWAKRMGSYATDTAYALAVDNYRDVYCTGYFQGTVDFDPGAGTFNLVSAGGEDVFISKLNESGNFLWAKRMGGTNYDVGYAVAVRGDQGVLTTGYFQGTVDFDPGTGVFNLVGSGGADVFLSALLFQPPTDIQLSSATVPEHAPIYTVVGSLSTTDPNPSATQTYTLAYGDGADDNALFTIVGNQLQTNSVLDFETKSAYSIRVRSRNNIGSCYDKIFIITAVDTAEMSIGDRVWKDADQNGVQDPGEQGIENVNVKLYFSADAVIGNADDRLLDETFTNAQGEYLLHKVGYGMNLYLLFRPPSYYAFTQQDSGGNDSLDSDANTSGFTGLFTLSAGQQDDTRDAGLIGSPLEGGWAIGIGGVNAEKSQAVATDTQGNSYVTGYFMGTADFDPGPGTYYLTSKGSYDVFVAKYSPQGTLLWAKRLGDLGYDIGSSLVVGSGGIVYIIGSFQGTVDFDPGAGTFNLTSAGGADIFLSMLDVEGNFYYAQRLGGNLTDQGLSIALGSDGSLVTTGYFSGTATFTDPWGATSTLSSAGSTDIFIYKLDADWHLAWARRLGGSGADQGLSVAVGSDGSVLTTGYFSGAADFDPGAATFNLTSAGSTDIFISKLDAAGNFVWARQMGGNGPDQGLSLALKSDGSVFTTGIFYDTVDFDPGTETFNLTSAGNTDIFISKLDAAGNFVWARRIGGTDTDQGLSLALASDGSVLTTGFFSGTVDFDPGADVFNLISAGSNDIFISKLDDAGEFVGAWRIGGIGLDNGISLVAGSQGSILTTGVFAGLVDFNLGPEQSYLKSVGNSDNYLAKYYLNAPNAIQLTSSTIQENQPVGALVGLLFSTDPDPGEAFNYELVPGAGDTDNGFFLIDGNQLKSNAIFDYETKSSYHIRVRTRDCGGQGFEKIFTISIVDQSDPPSTRIWDGGGNDNLWTNPQNWLGEVAPLPGDSLLFPALAAQKENVNNYASQTAFQSILFTGAGYTLSGNGVLLTSGIIDSVSETLDNTIAFSTITLYASQTFVNLHTPGKLVVQSNINLGNSSLTVDGSGVTLIEGDISGNAGITKTGSGELTLTGTDAYSGDTTVAAGALYTGSIGAHDQPTTKVEVQENAQLEAVCVITGSLTIGAGAKLTISATQSGSGVTSLDTGPQNLTAAVPQSPASDILFQQTVSNSVLKSPTITKQINAAARQSLFALPIYWRFDYEASTTKTNEKQFFNLLPVRSLNNAKNWLLSSKQDQQGSNTKKTEKQAAVSISGRQIFHNVALQSINQNTRRKNTDEQDGKIDHISFHRNQSPRRDRLNENAVDALLALD